jgi:2-polyprenyl-3-methyl-5-hydroxy-6-metoxy-1,4-benzoquinol methylase
MEDMDTDERIFLKKKHLFANSRRWFRFVFCYGLRYYLKSIVYAIPFFAGWLTRTICCTSAKANKDPAFWDRELAGPYSWYLGGTLPIDIRRTIMVELIQRTIPCAQSMLDIGCAAGGLALTASREWLKYYVGVDISEYAIKKAMKQVLEDKKIYSAKFYACNLCDFTPENDAKFDVIVFSEVLYYLDVKEAVVQLERYSNWLQPRGAFCISMKDDPKSHAICRAISRKFQHLNSVLLQVNPAHCGVRYRKVVNQLCPAFTIGVFTPRQVGRHRTVEHSFAQSGHGSSSEDLLEKKDG